MNKIENVGQIWKFEHWNSHTIYWNSKIVFSIEKGI